MAVQGCIDGTLVIELADGWSAGAVAGRLLSELGARVIKLEPAGGDRLRHIVYVISGRVPTEDQVRVFARLTVTRKALHSLSIRQKGGRHSMALPSVRTC